MNKVRIKNENKLKQYLSGHDKPTISSTNQSGPKSQTDKGNNR